MKSQTSKFDNMINLKPVDLSITGCSRPIVGSLLVVWCSSRKCVIRACSVY